MEYQIKQHVYHITPESPMGIVINKRKYSNKSIEYLVSFSIDDSVWIFDDELQTSMPHTPWVFDVNPN